MCDVDTIECNAGTGNTDRTKCDGIESTSDALDRRTNDLRVDMLVVRNDNRASILAVKLQE